MEPIRFDRLARVFGAHTTRRAALTAIVTLVIAPATAGAVTVCRAPGASCTRNAQCCSGFCPTSRSAPRAQRNRCTCPPDSRLCGAACVPLDDPTNCGGCGIACGADESCRSGICVLADICTLTPEFGVGVLVADGSVRILGDGLTIIGMSEWCWTNADCATAQICSSPVEPPYPHHECLCLIDVCLDQKHPWSDVLPSCFSVNYT